MAQILRHLAAPLAPLNRGGVEEQGGSSLSLPVFLGALALHDNKQAPSLPARRVPPIT